MISKFNVGLKTLKLRDSLSEPEFYGDLVYKFNKLIGRNDFYFQFGNIIIYYRRIGCNLHVMRESVCLVFNQIMVDSYEPPYADFFNCTSVGRASDSMIASTKDIHFSWLRPGLLVCCLVHRRSTVIHLLQVFSDVVRHPRLSIAGQLIVSVSPRF